MHAGKIDELYRLLVREDEHVANLLEAASRKRDALVMVEPADVEAAARLEEAVARDIDACEMQRNALIAELGELLSMEGEVSIETIARTAGEPHLTRLMTARASIREKAARVKKVNELNEMLAAQSTAHVRGMLTLFALGGEERTYSNPKAKGAKPQVSSIIVDRRV
jgi:tetrahydromethanopterin S-methyltransferase subunit A